MSTGRRHGPKVLRREQHVRVVLGKDGPVSAEVLDQPPAPPADGGEYGEPCYDCSCCRVWTENLEVLRAHVSAHNARVKPLIPCPGECLICNAPTWTGETA